jgi:hypothetical protein
MLKKDYGPGNAPEHYATLTEEEREAMTVWIRERLEPTPRKPRPANRLNSYGLKHCMERETGVYVTNGQFKGGMQAAGYEAFDTDDINWTYEVRIKKPEGRKQTDERRCHRI